MGWLFGKKKKPKVPFPQGHPLNEEALRFPDAPPSGKVIEPEQVKEAVGFANEESFPQAPPAQEPDYSSLDELDETFSAPAQPMPQEAAQVPPTYREPQPHDDSYHEEGPLYVKVDVYQRILGEMDELKHEINHVKDTQRHLEDSEYNEEAHFDKLRKSMKTIHDELLQVDRVLFKTHE